MPFEKGNSDFALKTQKEERNQFLMQRLRNIKNLKAQQTRQAVADDSGASTSTLNLHTPEDEEVEVIAVFRPPTDTPSTNSVNRVPFGRQRRSQSCKLFGDSGTAQTQLTHDKEIVDDPIDWEDWERTVKRQRKMGIPEQVIGAEEADDNAPRSSTTTSVLLAVNDRNLEERGDPNDTPLARAAWKTPESVVRIASRSARTPTTSALYHLSSGRQVFQSHRILEDSRVKAAFRIPTGRETEADAVLPRLKTSRRIVSKFAESAKTEEPLSETRSSTTTVSGNGNLEKNDDQNDSQNDGQNDGQNGGETNTQYYYPELTWKPCTDRICSIECRRCARFWRQTVCAGGFGLKVFQRRKRRSKIQQQQQTGADG